VADLWRTLGYDEVAVRIARAFSARAGISVLEGPPGVGKSSLARGIGALWEAGGGSTIVAEGDPSRTDMELYPFKLSLAGLSSGWKEFAPGAASVTKAAESLLGTAGLLTTVVQD